MVNIGHMMMGMFVFIVLMLVRMGAQFLKIIMLMEVMAVIVLVPMFMHHRFMEVIVVVFFIKQQNRAYDHQGQGEQEHGID